MRGNFCAVLCTLHASRCHLPSCNQNKRESSGSFSWQNEMIEAEDVICSGMRAKKSSNKINQMLLSETLLEEHGFMMFLYDCAKMQLDTSLCVRIPHQAILLPDPSSCERSDDHRASQSLQPFWSHTSCLWSATTNSLVS